MAKIT